MAWALAAQGETQRRDVVSVAAVRDNLGQWYKCSQGVKQFVAQLPVDQACKGPTGQAA